jgi:hypothetical protein
MIPASSLHELSFWLEKQQELYRNLRLTPLKVQLLQTIGRLAFPCLRYSKDTECRAQSLNLREPLFIVAQKWFSDQIIAHCELYGVDHPLARPILYLQSILGR